MTEAQNKELDKHTVRLPLDVAKVTYLLAQGKYEEVKEQHELVVENYNKIRGALQDAQMWSEEVKEVMNSFTKINQL